MSWPPKRPLVPLALFLIAVLWILDSLFPPTPSFDLGPLTEKRQSFEGVLLESPTPREKGLRAELLLTGAGLPSKARVLLTIEEVSSPLAKGDRIEFKTRLKRPTWFKNPGGFNYQRTLERRGIFLTGHVPPGNWELLKRSAERPGTLSRLRSTLQKKIDQNARTEAAPLLKALIVGDRVGLTRATWEDFRKTGTAHLLAISGQHVGLVALFGYIVFLWLLKRSVRLILTFSVRRTAAWLSLLPAFFYVFLAGAPPSALRAAIMLTIGVLALQVRRDTDIFQALAAAVILIGLIHPKAPFDLSFQLSFLAVLFLALFVAPFTRPFEREDKKKPFWFRWILIPLAVTVAATFGTAPLIAYRFHFIPLSGFLANLWAVPYVGLLLGMTGASLILCFLIPPLGGLSLRISGEIAQLFLTLIHHAANWMWVVPSYPTERELLGAYLLLGLLAVALHSKSLRIAALISGFLLVIGLVFPWSVFRNDLKVTFLDVGQGDAALIQTPSGENILIDGGGFLIPGRPRSFEVGEEVVVPYLKREGIRRIDLILLSHPHPDHYGGLEAVVESFPVGEFWWNGQEFPDETFTSLIETLQKKRIPIKVVQASWRDRLGRVTLEVLYPEKVVRGFSINDNCLVIRATYGKTRFLFAGDIERYAEERLVERVSDLKAEVLKIPHHGSKTSSSVPLIDAVSPRYAVVSLAEGNSFGFPSPGVLEKYERREVKVFRTDQNGAVTFTSDGRRVKVKPYISLHIPPP